MTKKAALSLMVLVMMIGFSPAGPIRLWPGRMPAQNHELMDNPDSGSAANSALDPPPVLKNYQTLSDSVLIQPTDFIYLGAFRLPDETSNGTSWSYGGSGMSYYSNGDPTGGGDGYPGSLFSIGHPNQGLVSEFSIPAPIISANKNAGELPSATTLQPFAELTNGRQNGDLTGLILSDVQYYPRQGSQTSDKLYWVMYQYYMPQNELGHGWSELDLSQPQSQGVWRLGDFPTSTTNKYLFEIPPSWADAYTPGKYLLAGRNRVPNDGSWGPAMYAFGPWNDGNPPANGSAVSATQLLYYPYDNENYFADHMIKDYSHADEWHDGAWLTRGQRSAVMLAGVKALRREYELEYYGPDNVDGCGDSKGWHAEPYYAALLFYDPLLLAASVQGTIAAHEIQPYAVLNLEDYMFQQGCRRQTLGGVGYDRQHGLVYIMEKEVAVETGKPIVHVFRLAEQGQAADGTPPSVPTNLRVDAASATQVDFRWDAASDNTHLAGYIIYRYGEPIATTTETFYHDNKINPSAAYTYTVVAWDASNNLSASSTLVVTTPGGTDTRMPIISNIKYSSLSATSITIRWQTDEPATTVFTYGVEYAGNDLTYQNGSLTRQHQAVLSGLTPESTYYIPAFVSTDAAGHTNAFPVENWQFTTPPAGSALNFRPILNGIGSKRVAVGEQVEFTLYAIDRDADHVLTYSATGLPPGATFTPATRQFSWTPASAGMVRITFAVSDGDQTDSERVTIFVAGELKFKIYLPLVVRNP
jgi:hypothetical protein